MRRRRSVRASTGSHRSVRSSPAACSKVTSCTDEPHRVQGQRADRAGQSLARPPARGPRAGDARQLGRGQRPERPMNRDVTTAAPQRGRPRSEKAHQAILEASAELLLEKGLAAVSMDAVAARAGVSKATIYRWWPTKETLALDTLYNKRAAAPPPPH